MLLGRKTSVGVKWRAQQGFQISDDMDDHNPSLTSLEKLKSYHLQSLTPIFILLAIHKKFKDGD